MTLMWNITLFEGNKMKKYKYLLVVSVVFSLLIIISATAQSSEIEWRSLNNQEEKEIRRD